MAWPRLLLHQLLLPGELLLLLRLLYWRLPLLLLL
jgi:hypothetical protein